MVNAMYVQAHIRQRRNPKRGYGVGIAARQEGAVFVSVGLAAGLINTGPAGVGVHHWLTNPA